MVPLLFPGLTDWHRNLGFKKHECKPFCCLLPFMGSSACKRLPVTRTGKKTKETWAEQSKCWLRCPRACMPSWAAGTHTLPTPFPGRLNPSNTEVCLQRGLPASLSNSCHAGLALVLRTLQDLSNLQAPVCAWWPSSLGCSFPTQVVQFSSVAQSRPTLCHPMNRSTPGLPVNSSGYLLLILQKGVSWP